MLAGTCKLCPLTKAIKSRERAADQHICCWVTAGHEYTWRCSAEMLLAEQEHQHFSTYFSLYYGMLLECFPYLYYENSRCF